MTVELQREIDRLAREAFFYEGPAIDRETSLIEAGVIDSTGVLELVAFLEKHYGIRIEDAEVTPEQLDTIARIETLVARKLGNASEQDRDEKVERLGSS
jgi:acyl carrier protein